jgi:VWFA-related protein
VKCVLISTTALLLAVVVFGAEPEPTQVLVSVTDKQGLYVNNLRAEDFTLTEDGKARPLASITPPGQLPVSLVLMVDVSFTMRRAAPLDKPALINFSRGLIDRGKDHGSLILFGHKADLRQDFTDDAAVFAASVNRIDERDYGGATSLFDTLDVVSDFVRKRAGRKIVLLVTDVVGDSSSRNNEKTILPRLRDNAVELYVMRPGPTKMRPNNTKALDTLAQETGGRTIKAETEKEAAKNLELLAMELRSQYFLDYLSTSKQKGNKRKISVSARNRELKTNVAGYRVAPR